MDIEIIIALVAGVIAVVFSGYLTMSVLKKSPGNARMQEISDATREGAMAYLKRQYMAVGAFVVVLALALLVGLGVYNAVVYVIGAVLSALTGYLGMNIATRANSRTTQAASESLNSGLRVAFSSGAVMGLSVVGLGVVGISVAYVFLDSVLGGDATQVTGILASFGLGASSIALFARVGGGIFTKAADVGADLVGKVEAGIPEDDPRNPATIADNVGDNVGDVAGMGADLFESYVNSIIATMALGLAAGLGMAGVWAPLLIAAVGILASIIGTFLVKTKEDASMGDLLWSLRIGIYGASGILVVFAYVVISYLGLPMNIFYSVVVGLVAGNVIGFITEYYTAAEYKPTQEVAAAAQTGAGTCVISGLAVGMVSTFVPVMTVVVAIMIAFKLGGMYGVAIAAVGMLSTLGITLATDAYGPVADNAGGIAEMTEDLDESVREKTDALDSLGNTTAATGKGFAIGSAALTALALLAAYAAVINSLTGQPLSIDLTNPAVLSGLFIGAMLPFLFSAFTMKAVGKAAFDMIKEVRRQFKEIPGIMEGTGKPDYAACVSISTAAAQREMILPGLMAVAAPLLVGFLLGPAALGGMLAGAVSAGFCMAVMMANAGGSWDNAKKYIEAGHMGGKGSDAHKAAVTGDTVGDPFKDTSGPSINILIKLMSVVALVFAPLFV
jgi:K(+)-stimulated pyrophosphate-energized sodium pump